MWCPQEEPEPDRWRTRTEHRNLLDKLRQHFLKGRAVGKWTKQVCPSAFSQCWVYRTISGCETEMVVVMVLERGLEQKLDTVLSNLLSSFIPKNLRILLFHSKLVTTNSWHAMEFSLCYVYSSSMANVSSLLLFGSKLLEPMLPTKFSKFQILNLTSAKRNLTFVYNTSLK